MGALRVRYRRPDGRVIEIGPAAAHEHVVEGPCEWVDDESRRVHDEWLERSGKPEADRGPHPPDADDGDPDPHLCGAPTARGGTCSREVSAPGAHCFQHGG